MIYPLLPMFVVAVLGASATELGWIEGSAAAMVALLTAYAGVRSDRYRRRVPWVRWGYGLPVLGKAVLVGAVAWPMVYLGRTIDRLGKGLRSSPRDALIADATPPAQRGRAFGLHRAMDTAGALVGVLASAFLLWWLSGTPRGDAATGRADAGPYRVIFAIAAAMGLAALALTFLVREAPRPAPPPVAAGAPPADASRALPRSYWIVLAAMMVFAVANSSDTFLILRAVHVGMSPWKVVLAYALFNLVYTVASYPAGALSDRLGRWRVIGVGWAIYALVYAGFARSDATTIWPLFACYGLYMALTDGVGKALVADHAPADRRGRALGVFYLATGLATIAASLLAGVAWDQLGPSAPFWIGAGGAALAVAIVPVAARWSRPTPA
ncbi:MAG: MFS transporter [Myxococcales bacterium]|nr:MFS transporter [Myxococcales bacterium]